MNQLVHVRVAIGDLDMEEAHEELANGFQKDRPAEHSHSEADDGGSQR